MTEKQKVLIVDDEPKNQRIIVEVLEDLVDLKAASTGEEALQLINSFQPNLVLLDIMMPGIDGYEVCRQIRANSKLSLIKVILVSGKAMVEERLKGYEVGADDYMTKPFILEELLAKSKVFLRLSQLEQNLEKQVQEGVSQLLVAESKLVAAAKMSALGEMAGGIAHEINTPLGTIGLIAEQIQELIQEETIDRSAIEEMSKTTLETVRRISTIIHGLRTFSRDSSKDKMTLVPLKQVVENTLALCGERFKQANVKVEWVQPPDDLKIFCRSVQISQVVLNLLGNAYDAVQSLPEKWIKINVEKQGDNIAISVTDSGNGIPEKVRNKLFQPFFTTKEIGKGTGLGLSISKGIVDAHNGSISVDSSSKNTRFILQLPTGSEAKKVT